MLVLLLLQFVVAAVACRRATLTNT